ncbi:REP element-mobilizing transposase RayT [Microbulbifer donghaiensis]|uniref:REP element-mobilizing transposase RayT n=1 Tax=Microbulbifer donghaiensis TaxID=494016 RepID=A0A1M5CQV3_9GAMM|nr:transposase [Microbulbifer donghaiensis]SHF57134.1 REP element-mobilizing transposase RayT [Microbulbifer donghaiensis]
MNSSPESHRLRFGQFSEPNRIYLITANCFQRQPIFSDLQRGRAFVRALMHSSRSAETLSYVVMPDHVQWLMQIRKGAELSAIVQKVKSQTSKALKRQDRQLDRNWQRGFHDHALRKEEDLIAMARYVVANPLRAGLVKSLRDYPLWDAIWL